MTGAVGSRERIEIREFLRNMPGEEDRSFEKRIASLAQDEKYRNLEEDGGLPQILTGLADDGRESEETRFAAFCTLATYYRRIKNEGDQKAAVEMYRERFGGHVFFRHIELLCYLDDMNADTIQRLLLKAKASAQALGENAGALHLFSDLVVTGFENDWLCYDDEDQRREWFEPAWNYLMEAMTLDRYAKFYCTKARMLKVSGRYEEAVAAIKAAVDKEDPNGSSYAIRIGEYQYHRMWIQNEWRNCRTREEMNRYSAEIMENQRLEMEGMQKKMIEGIQEAQGKNLEFIGLFAGIISFTIGGITLAGGTAGISFLGAAGLLVVLMGTLLCVFAGFGIILHGLRNSKAWRNAAVLALGILIIFGGIHVCLSV